MWIVCLLKERGGTIPQINGRSYHFKPNAAYLPDTSAHVCFVANPDHAALLLKVESAYRKGQDFDADSGQSSSGHTLDSIDPEPGDAQVEPGDAQVEPASGAKDFTDMTDDELRNAYAELNSGRTPPASIKRETMIEKLQAAAQSKTE